ncbi:MULTISPECIES: alanine--tRNA ligase [unclassified Granulicatella]|uniref:alanine--tRNA ligase n=1 Tax=unclassified Granulicatella TaxID=2630493 RepID=UPI00107302E7|nr:MULTISPECIES: alanine--tRNA ligase [unclassified Granulicatella]MBF0780769.1 alanine--tRNA ligase [Granulicatella sp. 19428wC4_WM01]TFU93842.1 alanine--tRNA ligase [Granulicatella sp. WM01]
MKPLTSSQIRQKYLDFFKSKQHDIIPSASLIPINDPTLLWINAGVAPLKKYFDGSLVPTNPRLANTQKCIRTNDIDNVGVTARHHTLFEMLGNWSIGNYFKEEAISWAWEFLTSPEWLGFEPEKLYATYYPKDEETPTLWRKQPHFISDHLVPFEDNFWDIGAGPCGPCTEIFYDRGPEFLDIAEDDPENYPGGENERYLEIWNLVFSEFNHMPDDTYQPLPRKNIDTGMGLERMSSVIQNTKTNFETDLFMPIIEKIQSLSPNKTYGENKDIDTSFKVIADHIRAVSFAIGDGALPSNEGRGYILRRLIRRSVMHGQKLGITGTFLTELVSVVGEIMGQYYPEIVEKHDFIVKVIGSEETKFHETLHDGLTLLEQVFSTMEQDNKQVVDGLAAFKLYDTYGFPLELTQEYASERGYRIDTESFDTFMKKQKERARAARHKEESMNVQSDLYTNITVASAFVGYETDKATSVLRVAIVQDELVDTILMQQKAQLIFDKTPFYAEMGGQVADTGVIVNEDNQVVAHVIDVKKAPNGQAMHSVEVLLPMQVDKEYTLCVDKTRRHKITKNHTATHLLHQALKDVLGEHANQAGSYVTPNGLRFDFTHFGQVTKDELKRMEQLVNQKIWAALPVVTLETTLDKAKELGAMALFGEKYGKHVRVVNIGEYSIELCGGIHVSNTQEIGLFQIVSESGIGAGTRRIEALTSQEAYAFLTDMSDQLQLVAKQLKSAIHDVPKRIEQLQAEHKQLTHELNGVKESILKQESTRLFEQVECVNGLRVILADTSNKEMNELRTLADTWKQADYSDVFVVASAKDGKVSLLVAANKTANDKGVKAGDLIKQIAPLVGGGGGGRADMAQAGGKNPAGIKSALEKVSSLL